LPYLKNINFKKSADYTTDEKLNGPVTSQLRHHTY